MGKKYWRAMAGIGSTFNPDKREAYEVSHGEILVYRVARGLFKHTYTLTARDPIKPETQVKVGGGACQVKTPGVDSYDYYVFDGVEKFAAEVRSEISRVTSA